MICRQRSLVVVFAVTVFLAAGFSSSWSAVPPLPEFPKLTFNPPHPERYVMPNGLVVYFLEDHDLPVIHMNWMFRTGTEFEPADKIGLANVFAETWTQGGTTTRKPLDVARFLERKAAGVSFSMGLESGSGSLSCRTTDFADVFTVFTDLLLKPDFQKEYLDLAKAKALESLRRMNDDPEDIMRREFRRLMYGADHPYARIASPESLERIKRDDLMAWHKKFIIPNTSFVAIAGDFDTATMKKTLAASLAGWAKAAIEPLEVPPPPAIDQKQIWYVQRPIAQTQIRVGYLAYKRHSEDAFAWSVFNELWGGSASSRLFRTVRTSMGLAYAVGSASFIPEQQGIVVAVSQTRGPQSITATQAMLSINAEIRTAHFTADEIHDAKETLINQYLQNFATAEQISSLHMSNEFFGFPRNYLDRYLDRISQVTATDVKRVAQTYLKPDHAMVLLVGDLSTFEKPIGTLGKARPLEIKDYSPHENTR